MRCWKSDLRAALVLALKAENGCWVFFIRFRIKSWKSSVLLVPICCSKPDWGMMAIDKYWCTNRAANLRIQIPRKLVGVNPRSSGSAVPIWFEKDKIPAHSKIILVAILISKIYRVYKEHFSKYNVLPWGCLQYLFTFYSPIREVLIRFKQHRSVFER